VLVGPDQPLTLVVHAERRFLLCFPPAGPELRSLEPAGVAVATAFVPGIARETVQRVRSEPTYDEGPVRERFVLDIVRPIDGAEDGGLRIGGGGAAFRADARARTVDIDLLEETATLDGALEVRGSRWNLDVQASATLHHLRPARGSIRVRASDRADLTITADFTVPLGTVWEDPSGVLAFHRPVAWVEIDWRAGRWVVKGALSGRLELRTVPLGDGAGAWVSEVFSGLELELDRLTLRDLLDLAGDDTSSGRFPIALRFKDRPRLSLWDGVFNLVLQQIRLGPGLTLAIGGEVDFDVGPVTFGGSLPQLGVSLAGGRVHLLDGFNEFAIRGGLELASGLSARIEVRRTHEDGEEVLLGSGVVRTSGLPAVGVAVRLGQFTTGGQHKPTIALYGETAVSTPLFPGVVLREVGLGVGIHSSLRGLGAIEARTPQDIFDLLAATNGPDPLNPADWQRQEDAVVTVVARCAVAATPGPPSEPDYYVADAVMSLDARLRLRAFGNLWLLTSLVCARKAAFRAHPSAEALLALDVAEPSLALAARTRRDGKSSVDGPGGLVRALTVAETRLALVARPSSFLLQLGPSRFDESHDFGIGTLHMHAHTLFAVRAGRNGLWMAAEASAGSSFSTKIDLGIVSFRASAGFYLAVSVGGGLKTDGGAEVMLWGQGTGRVWVRLAITVRLRFTIRVKLAFVKITISFELRFDFSIGADARLDLALALGTDRGVGFDGRVVVAFSVMGIGVSLPIPIRGGDQSLLSDAQTLHQQLVQNR